jgi:transposase
MTTTASDPFPDDTDALKAALIETRAKLSGAEALIEHLQLLIAKMKRELFGPRSERSQRLLDQLELQLEELAAATAEDEAKVEAAGVEVRGFTRARTRRDFPAHLPRRRVVHPAPSACPCCGGTKLSKIGEDITETLDVVPRQLFVTQHVREKFSCRTCEKITQPPAPFHAIARGFAGPSLLAMILVDKYVNHQPLNRQSDQFAREGVELSLSTMADHVGACAASLMPLYELIKAHVFAAERIHGDETTVPVLAKLKTRTGRLWTYVRDDRPFGGNAAPAAVYFYSPDRGGEHPERHLASYQGHPAGRRLFRLHRAVRAARAEAGPDCRSSMLGACATQAVRARRRRLEGTQQELGRDLADRIRCRPKVRCRVRRRARDQWTVADRARSNSTQGCCATGQ